MTRLLVSGAAGFVGHHFVQHALLNTDWELVFLDRLDLSGNLSRLREVIVGHERRCKWHWHDLKAPIKLKHLNRIDCVVHLAASTHVDRSILDPMSFVMDNVVGTCNLLEWARIVGVEKFVNFSTDEVFGPAPPGTAYREWDRYRSGNPYAATKAGAEELGIAYHNTYGVPVITTHTMNVYGERQHAEKYIPSTIRKVRDGECVTIHADRTRTIPGSRFYIHARSVASAVLLLLEKGEPGQKYNIVGEREVDNLELAERVARAAGRPLEHELVDFHGSRPGHDLRYALDGSKMAALGWKPAVAFDEALERTVRWSLKHEEWLNG